MQNATQDRKKLKVENQKKVQAIKINRQPTKTNSQ